MPVVPMQQILKHAFDNRYGVGAFNIVDWVTMDAVLSAATETSSPVIVQVSVKTVKVTYHRQSAYRQSGYETGSRRVHYEGWRADHGAYGRQSVAYNEGW